MLTDLILGTAGHIDHGKTSLIGALTGTNTDRLPEEKKRGITIELGYAHLDLPPFRMGVVDVPGHEKFVRQMLAGATGMDVVMLVIAGDDSIKQQTTEHLDILRMLDLPAGVIALTKCDMCDPDWLELVEDEVRQLVSDTFLHDAPIIRTSSKTGEGIPELKAALVEAAEKVAATDRATLSQAPFRMAIDRSFSIAGHGTVVTGSVNSGQISVGDQIVIQPGNSEVRIRGIQNHDSASESVSRGQRAAVNLAGVHHTEIGRGHELGSPGHLEPSKLMTVELSLLSSTHRKLKDRTRVRFHVGTAELFANVRLLDCDVLEPGQKAFAQLYLNEAVVAVWSQPFVIRMESPVETIGGGRVLTANANPIKKPSQIDLEMLQNLASKDLQQRASAGLYFSTTLDWQPKNLNPDAGVADHDSVAEQLRESGTLIEIELSQTRRVTIHKSRFEEIGRRVLHSLKRLHADKPLRFQHPRNVVEHEFDYLRQPELLALVIEQLKKDKQVIANVSSIGLVGYGPKLSKGQKVLLGQLIDVLSKAGIEPPTVGDLIKSASKNKDSVEELLEMAKENGDLVHVADGFYMHRDEMSKIQGKLRSALAGTLSGMTMSDLRQELGTSRKYAIPILEYLDAIGFTVREGDLRTLGDSSDQP
ncbi:selenocysteine-specific translation elongation factor [Mariniblastus sp.]|nr:selenocysteine-specific translation elongation factor [Mariniblastus sp.]